MMWGNSLQVAGGLFELLGLTVVIVGLDRRSRRAGHGSLWQRLWGKA